MVWNKSVNEDLRRRLRHQACWRISGSTSGRGEVSAEPACGRDNTADINHDDQDSPPPPPPAHGGIRPRSNCRLPGKSLIIADRFRFLCKHHDTDGSCSALHKSNARHLSAHAPSAERRTGANGVATAESSWPTLSIPGIAATPHEETPEIAEVKADC